MGRGTRWGIWTLERKQKWIQSYFITYMYGILKD